jgi:tRNA dimethylallyltransferase
MKIINKTSNGVQKPRVIVILGQTATGKSDLAVKIAKKVSGEIISADSRQVYKGLDIGTGKITAKEMHGISHYLLDVANPNRPARRGGKFTVAQYKKLAEQKIEEIVARGKIPIICGGTGFYLDAVTKGTIFPEVPPNEKIRKILYRKSAIALFRYLEKLDPKRAKNIKEKNEQNNKVRLIRAIEIAKALGRVPLRAEASPPYKFIKIGLYLPAPILKRKVEKRVQKMFQMGLLREIKKLKSRGISEKRLKELGFEYYHPTKERVIIETLKYAKRQMTWFRRDPEIIWFDASKKDLLKKILKRC